MATPQFHPLRIREVRPETADAVSVAFEVPVELRELYRFTQGQFVTANCASASSACAADAFRTSLSILCSQATRSTS
jgi:ferredoxin-NADP reductase